MKTNRDSLASAGLLVVKNSEHDYDGDRVKLLQSLLRQKTKQLDIISNEATEQRRQVVQKNQIIAEYESLYNNLRDSKEKEVSLLKDELVYRNNVIKAQLHTIEKLRVNIRKMDSLLPLNQYEAMHEEETVLAPHHRARAKGISAEPSFKHGTAAKIDIEKFFFHKRQRYGVAGNIDFLQWSRCCSVARRRMRSTRDLIGCLIMLLLLLAHSA
eukprot:gene12823-14139_t